MHRGLHIATTSLAFGRRLIRPEQRQSGSLLLTCGEVQRNKVMGCIEKYPWEGE
jgi:hypothetical protein